MAKKIEYPKLPKKFKEKWLNALRSGNFKRGASKLHKVRNNIDTYCCLGVACKIAHPKLDLGDNGYIYDFIPTTKVPKILLGHADDKIVVKKLATMNDSDNYSFNRIADWIEENL